MLFSIKIAIKDPQTWTMNFVVVGEERCGKTKLVERYLRKSFSADYKRTGIEEFTASIKVAAKPARLNIWDFGGHISLNDIQSQALLKSADVILYCYDLSKPIEVDALQTKLEYFLSKVSDKGFVFLVGCKADLKPALSPEEQSALDAAVSKLDGCKAFLASSKADAGVSNVFLDAIRCSYATFMADRERALQEEMQRADASEKRSRWLNKHLSQGESLEQLFVHARQKAKSTEKLFTVLAEKLDRHDVSLVNYLKRDANLLLLCRLAFTDPSVTVESYRHASALFTASNGILKAAIAHNERALVALFTALVTHASQRTRRAALAYAHQRKTEGASSPSEEERADIGSDSQSEKTLSSERLPAVTVSAPTSPLKPNVRLDRHVDDGYLDVERLTAHNALRDAHRGRHTSKHVDKSDVSGEEEEEEGASEDTSATSDTSERSASSQRRSHSSEPRRHEAEAEEDDENDNDDDGEEEGHNTAMTRSARGTHKTHSSHSAHKRRSHRHAQTHTRTEAASEVQLPIRALDTTTSAVPTPRYTLSPREAALQRITRSHGEERSERESSGKSADEESAAPSSEVEEEQSRLLSAVLVDLCETHSYPLHAFLTDHVDMASALFVNFDSLMVKLLVAVFRAEQQIFVLDGSSDRKSLFARFSLGRSLLLALRERPHEVLESLTPFLESIIELSPTCPTDFVSFEDFELVRRVMHYLKRPQCSPFASKLLADIILRQLVKASRDSADDSLKPVLKVIQQHINDVKILLYSRSISDNFRGVEIACALSEVGGSDVLRPLLAPILEVYFSHPNASVISFSVTKLITRIFHDKRERLYPFIFNDGSLIARLVHVYEKKGDEAHNAKYQNLRPMLDQIIVKMVKHKIDYAAYSSKAEDLSKFQELIQEVAREYDIGHKRANLSASASKSMADIARKSHKAHSSGFHTTPKRLSLQLSQPTPNQIRDKQRLLVTLAASDPAKAFFDSS